MHTRFDELRRRGMLEEETDEEVKRAYCAETCLEILGSILCSGDCKDCWEKEYNEEVINEK